MKSFRLKMFKKLLLNKKLFMKSANDKHFKMLSMNEKLKLLLLKLFSSSLCY